MIAKTELFKAGIAQFALTSISFLIISGIRRNGLRNGR